MKEYNVSSLITILMDIIADSQINTGTVVLEAVATHPNVNVDVTPTMISNLMNRKTDVHGDIKRGASQKAVADFARIEINKKLMPRISPLRIDDFCTQVIETMRMDSKVSNGICDLMQRTYADKEYLEFACNAVLYALSVTNLPKDAVTSPEDMLLLSQSSYKCPLKGEPLWKKTRKNSEKYIYSFQIVKIYPENLSDELKPVFDMIHPPPRSLEADDNRIPLCKACAEAYVNDPSPETYKRLLECKQRILKKQRTDKVAAESAIEDEIVTIIKAIASADGEAGLEPFTDVLKIKEKILPKNYLLEEAIHDDVIKFYPFIEEQFSLLDDYGTSTFNIIRSEVSACYEKYEREGLEQNEIFEELSEWILKANGLGKKLKIAAGVVVSFFVQNCAVFKPLQGTEMSEDDDEDEEDI